MLHHIKIYPMSQTMAVSSESSARFGILTGLSRVTVLINIRKLKHSELKLQPFLASNHSEMTIQEKQFAMAARTRILDVKPNFKIGAADTKCRRCGGEEETQEHLLHCPALSDACLVAEVPHFDDLLWENREKIINVSRLLLFK